jgi:MATE family multidrug resistance protein
MMLTNMLAMGFSLVDTYVAGQLGPEALATVSVASSIFWLVMMPATGLLGAFQITLARCAGRQDYREMKRLWLEAICTAVGLAVIVLPLLALCYFFYTFSLSETLRAQVLSYLVALVPAAVAMLLWAPFNHYWQCRGRVLPWTILTILLQPVNYGLDMSLSTVPDVLGVLSVEGYGGALGVVGIGLATSACKWIEVLVIGCYTWWHWHRERDQYSPVDGFGGSIRKGSILRHCRLGLPMGLHTLADLAIFGVCTFLVAKGGTISLSAHQILFTINCIFYLAMDGWGTAMAIRLGQLLGQGCANRAQFVRAQFLIFCVLSGFACVVLDVLGPTLVGLVTDSVAIVAQAEAVWWVLLLFFVLDVIQNFWRNILQTLKLTQLNFRIFTLGFVVPGILLMILLVTVCQLGLLGVWLSLCVGMALCIAGYLCWFVRNRHLYA